jgi:hypothetical protein
MDILQQFTPPRQKGLLLHGGASLGLMAVSGLSLYFALTLQVGSYFVLLLLLSVFTFVPLPWVLYRGYALANARYTLERDGLRIRWGLRAEDIPLPDVEWVRPASDLAMPLPFPPLSWPGAITGTRTVEGLGQVEFIASDEATLLLIATPRKVFAVSPADPREFLKTFQYIIEMGSLTPLSSHSTLPAAFIQSVWKDRVVRWLVSLGLGFTVALFIVVGMLIPAQKNISLGFDPSGSRLPPVPAEQLLLLPVLAAFITVTDVIGGMFFYRRPNERPIAYLLFGSSIMTPILLMIATLLLI